MTKKRVRILRQITSVLLAAVLILSMPLTQALAYQQPLPPATYLDPDKLNANNPDPLTNALSKVVQSPFSQIESGLPQNKPESHGRVDLAGGALILNSTDLKIPSVGIPLDFSRTYNSSNTGVSPFGEG